jgi:hypothetical protein
LWGCNTRVHADQHVTTTPSQCRPHCRVFHCRGQYLWMPITHIIQSLRDMQLQIRAFVHEWTHVRTKIMINYLILQSLEYEWEVVGKMYTLLELI